MEKYICENCTYICNYDEIKIKKEFLGECHGNRAYETYSICPMCGADETMVEAEKCKKCGKLIAYKGLCEDCMQNLEKEWSYFWDELLSEERQYIADKFDEGVTI